MGNSIGVQRVAKEQCSRRCSLATFCIPMEFPVKFDTATSGWSIVYIEGPLVNISRLSLP